MTNQPRVTKLVPTDRMPQDLQIRPATEADVRVTLDFIRELAEYEKLLDEATVTEELLRSNLFGAHPRAEVILACESGQPVGFALYFHNFSTFVGKPGIYLEDLFIRPAFRGKGYGKALMIYLARLMIERDCGRFEWSVLDWNQPSLEFYRSIGAVPMDEWTVQRMTGAQVTALAALPLPNET